MIDKNSFAEKYRYPTLDMLIVPNSLRSILEGLAKGGKPVNLLFTSTSPGTGKTTAARALARAWGAEHHMFMNMAHEGKTASIPDIMAYADVEDLLGEEKVIVFDEANSAKSIPFQDPLKGILEQYDGQMACIMTSNGTGNIIDPLLSRCRPISFDFTGSEAEEVFYGMVRRIGGVCKKEEISFDEASLSEFIKSRYPDMRSMLLDLYIIKCSGHSLMTYKEAVNLDPFHAVPDLLIAGDWTSARKLVCDNMTSSDMVYRSLYDNLLPKLKTEDAISSCIVINRYEHASFSKVDREINIAAMFATLIQGLSKNGAR